MNPHFELIIQAMNKLFCAMATYVVLYFLCLVDTLVDGLISAPPVNHLPTSHQFLIKKETSSRFICFLGRVSKSAYNDYNQTKFDFDHRVRQCNFNVNQIKYLHSPICLLPTKNSKSLAGYFM